ALRSEVLQAARYLHVADVVQRRGSAQFAAPVIQDIERGRAGREIYVVTPKVVGFVTQDVVEFESAGDGSERLVDEVLRQARVPGAFVHLRAMVSKHSEHRFIVDLEA